jgi:hypothetical protein
LYKTSHSTTYKLSIAAEVLLILPEKLLHGLRCQVVDGNVAQQAFSILHPPPVFRRLINHFQLITLLQRQLKKKNFKVNVSPFISFHSKNAIGH